MLIVQTETTWLDVGQGETEAAGSDIASPEKASQREVSGRRMGKLADVTTCYDMWPWLSTNLNIEPLAHHSSAH